MNIGCVAKNQRILVIDDNQSIHGDFRKILTSNGEPSQKFEAVEADLLGPGSDSHTGENFEIDSAYQGPDGVALVRKARQAGRRYALAFVDVRMPPGWDGIETASRIWQEDPAVQIVICTAYTDYSFDEISRRLGINDRLLILKKPFDSIEARQIAHAMTEKWALSQQVESTLHNLERLVADRTRDLASVNEQLQKDEQLQRLTERWQLATSAAKLGVWDWNVHTDALIWDQSMHDLYGTSSSLFSGAYEAWRAMLHPDDAVPSEAEVTRAIEGPKEFDTMFRIIRGDGEVRYIRAIAATHRDPKTGRALRMAGLNWDITEQRVAEIALRRSEALQTAILAHAGLSIIASDFNGIITLFNRAAEEMLGYQAAEVVGLMISALFHDQEEVEARSAVLQAELGVSITSPFEVFVIKSRMGKSDTNEWTYIRKDGSRFPVMLTVSALRDPGGVLIGYLGVAVDLTHQKQHERELLSLNRLLEEQTAEAQSANQAKSTFVANMSHEIRTPLGAITGLAYLLGKTPLTVDQHGLLLTIERSAKTLLGMINDILDLSKIEAQQLTIEVAPFHLPNAIDELAGLMAGFAIGKKLELIVDAAPDLPDYVAGDRGRLMQILTNLLGNAIKFTDKGSVRLGVRSFGGDAENLSVRFEVQDSGPGIDAAALARLFTRFTQAESSAARRMGGTGLGLAIAKQLVTLMGGQIGVSSTPGSGSEFWCVIPFGLVLRAEVVPKKQSLSMLVIDDYEGQRQALAASAKRLGWRVESAASGQQGLEMLLERARVGDLYDIVVVDWQMPGLDGLQTMAAMREALSPDKPLPCFVMATSHDSSTLRTAQGGAIADMILAKPVTASSLFDAVVKAMSTRAGSTEFLGAALRRAEGVQRLPGVRILIVDDSEVNLDIARRILTLEGAEVETIDNGLAAVERVTADPRRLDVVLMDVQMPVLDGIEAVRRIRQRTPRTALSIIALTAGALTSEKKRALEAGMNDFISKPFDPEELILNVRQQVIRTRKSPLGVVTRPLPLPRRIDWPLLDGFDRDDASVRLGGDVQLFVRLLRQLLTELDGVRGLVSSPEAIPPADLIPRVHKLRGMAGNLGARDLHRAASRAEEVLRGEAPESLGGVLHRLVVEIDRARTAAQDVVMASLPSAESAPRPADGPLDPTRLKHLIRLLREQDLEAPSVFAELSPRLERCLGAAKHALLCIAINGLDFAKALELVDGLKEGHMDLGPARD